MEQQNRQKSLRSIICTPYDRLSKQISKPSPSRQVCGSSSVQPATWMTEAGSRLLKTTKKNTTAVFLFAARQNFQIISCFPLPPSPRIPDLGMMVVSFVWLFPVSLGGRCAEAKAKVPCY